MSEYKEESDQVSCEICVKEIPRSEAKSEEATEYVAHFCGLECYQKWAGPQGKEDAEKG